MGSVYGQQRLSRYFADAANFGELIFHCTQGAHALEALALAGPEHLAGKILIDISNPLDFSKGMPPALLPPMVNVHSLGEAIQQRLPGTFVVKTLNMVNCEVIVRADRCNGKATMFMAGNDGHAKSQTAQLLRQFGWDDIIDLGEIAHARGMEMMLPLWLSIYMKKQNPYFAFKVVH